MPKTKQAMPKPAQLRDAFVADLASCWQYARSLHPKETPYAYVLFGVEGTPQLDPHVLTEQGLEKAAKRYVTNGHYEKVEEARKALRYSIEDSPYSLELEGKLPTVDFLVEPIAHTLDETEGYSILAKAAMEAFAVLDKRDTFGTGKQREKCLLMIDTSFAEKDWSKLSAKRLNSDSATKRYESQTKVEGDYVGAHTFSISARGDLLCYDAYREVDPRAGKVFDDVVVCDVSGLRLKRRWILSAKGSEGRNLRVTCGADGTVVMTDDDRTGTGTKLTRFGKGAKPQAVRTKLSGSSGNVVVSKDGLRVATCINGELLILNDKLQTVAKHTAPQESYLVSFLESGDLLAVIKERLHVIQSSGITKPLPYPEKVCGVTLNSNETHCALSKSNKESLLRMKFDEPCGFKVLSFPSMKLLREFKIPGHRLTMQTISCDGTLVACDISACGQRKRSIVVYDIQSGLEVARRSVEHVGKMAFLPGKHVLLMTTSGHMKTEPIKFWKIE